MGSLVGRPPQINEVPHEILSEGFYIGAEMIERDLVWVHIYYHPLDRILLFPSSGYLVLQPGEWECFTTEWEWFKTESQVSVMRESMAREMLGEDICSRIRPYPRGYKQHRFMEAMSIRRNLFEIGEIG